MAVETLRTAVSNTRPARGSNAARKHKEKWMKILKEILGKLVYFLKKHWVLTQNIFLHLLMRDTIPCFQSHAARKTI